MLSRTNLIVALVAGLIASTSSPTFAALTTAEGIPDGNGNFYFSDINLGSGAAGFGTFSRESLVDIYTDVHYYTYNLQTYIDSANPFISNSTTESHSYITDSFGVIKESSWAWEITNENGNVMNGVVYTRSDPPYPTQVWGTILGDDGDYLRIGYVEVPIYDGEMLFCDTYPANCSQQEQYFQFLTKYRPITSYYELGNFDLGNSLVYYADGSSESLLLALKWSPRPFFSGYYVYPDVYRYTQAIGLDHGNISLTFSSYDEIVGISLAYTIPEPEIYAMLLAGLGIVGAVTRRRHIKSARNYNQEKKPQRPAFHTMRDCGTRVKLTANPYPIWL